MGAAPYRLLVPSTFDGRTGFDVDANHIFPQGVLAALTLVGCGAGNGGTRAAQGVRWDFLSAQWLSPPCQGQGLIKLLEQKPQGFDSSWLCFKCVIFTLPTLRPLPQTRGVLK